jgi:hypothetical protein
VDDPECCDRCDKFAYVVWRRGIGVRICPYCMRPEDFDEDEVLNSGK